MRCALSILLPAVLLAACGGAAPPTAPTPDVSARFPRGGLTDVIEVRALDRLPLRMAELIAPDGTATPAGAIDVNPSPRVVGGQYVVDNPFASQVGAAGAFSALSITHTEGGAALRAREQVLAVQSAASIALPDPVAYRRDWPRYRIRLGFGPAPEIREIAAPEPPLPAR